jgi:hypothetical protein
MKHLFKEGDGMIWRTSSKEEREQITYLLKENNYLLFRDYYTDNSWPEYPVNPFTNNFRFRKDGKWVTSNVSAVKNPMTFIQMESLIKNRDINYEIY